MVAGTVGIAHIFGALGMHGDFFGQPEFKIQALQGTDIGKGAISGGLAEGAPDEQGEKMHDELGLFCTEMHTVAPHMGRNNPNGIESIKNEKNIAQDI